MKRMDLCTVLLTLMVWIIFVMGMLPHEEIYGLENSTRMFPCLGLTSEQAKQIRNLRESFEREISPLRIREFERRAELRLLWMQMKADSKKIKAKQKEIHDLRWQIEEKTTDYWIAFRSVLTAEQLSKFIALGEELEPHPPIQERNPPLPGRGLGQIPGRLLPAPPGQRNP